MNSWNVMAMAKAMTRPMSRMGFCRYLAMARPPPERSDSAMRMTIRMRNCWLPPPKGLPRATTRRQYQSRRRARSRRPPSGCALRLALVVVVDLPADLACGERRAVHVRVRHARADSTHEVVESAVSDALGGRTDDLYRMNNAGHRARTLRAGRHGRGRAIAEERRHAA